MRCGSTADVRHAPNGLTGGSAGSTGATAGSAGMGGTHGGITVGGSANAGAAGAPSDAGAAGACSADGPCDEGCGNGRIERALGELCDDGNDAAGDGCSADCTTIERDFACTHPGKPCEYLVVCGDGHLGGEETCDDHNTASGDGCSAKCKLEDGWQCPAPGAPCVAVCGDAKLAGDEDCDPPHAGHGCSETCHFEPGYVCTPPKAGADPGEPASCHATSCGDGTREGSEACDDGNDVDGDGCSATCAFEPDCSTGACVSKCGDGIKLSPEACDDGNVRDGDGCSSDCALEDGFTCEDDTANPRDSLNLRVVYRDFISIPVGSNQRHPDFEADFAGDSTTPGLVKDTLADDGAPVMEGRCSDELPSSNGDTAECPYGQMLTTSANFDEWYHDTSGVNLPVLASLALPRGTDGAYEFDSDGQGFFPLDDKGFTVDPAREAEAEASSKVNDGLMHDFGFTTEVRYFFQYRGGESLAFSGDDDLWIFIHRKLVLDVGGLHPRTAATLDVDSVADSIGLKKDGLYEIALFHAERHTDASNFHLTLTGFEPVKSTCAPTCGDGVVTAGEQCDLGDEHNDGGYDGCTNECRLGPYCGDGVVQKSEEKCDDGVNVTTYSNDGKPGCAPGCQPSAYCGDGNVDGVFGEECDLGADENTGDYGGCTSRCVRAARCGDGVVQADHGEVCDDGNTVGGDGCTHDCRLEAVR